MKTYLWPTVAVGLLAWTTGCDDMPQPPDETQLPEETVQPVPSQTGPLDQDAPHGERSIQPDATSDSPPPGTGAYSEVPQSSGAAQESPQFRPPQEAPQFGQSQDRPGFGESEPAPAFDPSDAATEDPFGGNPPSSTESEAAAGVASDVPDFDAAFPEFSSDSPENESEERPGEQDLEELDVVVEETSDA